MKFDFNGKQYYIDGLLAKQLDTLVYNVKKDFDFVIIITGDRAVRVGKSVFAMQICAYLSYALAKAGMPNKYTLDDVYFDNQEMMTAAFKKPPYHVNHYDEGREGLAANKAMKAMQHDLLDFFAECGQMNHIFVIVAPDFFKLSEEIAVARSEYLLNVYRTETMTEIDLYNTGTKLPVVRLDRGRFEFFDRKAKQNLYDKSMSTRRKNYGLIKANFIGTFTNDYPLGEEEYRKKKKDSLARFSERKDKEKELKSDIFRNRVIMKLKKEGLIAREIREKLYELCEMELSPERINEIIRENESKEANKDTGTSRRLGEGINYQILGKDDEIDNNNE